MSKQDGYASRTPADLERKYKFGETFAEVFGLVTDARKIAEEAQSAIEGLDQEQIFNLLTNNGKAQGIYRDDKGDVYVNASFIRSGTLSDEQLPSSVALKSEIPKALSELVNDKGFVVESGVTTIVKGVVTTDYVNALGLKVKAANITGTLTIGQLPGTVAQQSDLQGFVDSDTVTTITNNAIRTAEISADQIKGGTIEGVALKSVGNYYGDVEIRDARIYVGNGELSTQGDITTLSNSSGVFVGASSGCVELAGAAVRVYFYSTSNYWEFAADGIYLKDGLGGIIQRVQLTSPF